MQQYLDYLTSSKALEYIARVEAIFKDAPHLPKGVRTFLVTITPWLSLIGGVLSALSVVSSVAIVFGVSMFAGMYERYVGISSVYFVVEALVQAVAAVLLLTAFPLLKKQQLEGWVYLYWHAVIGVVATVVALLFGLGVSLIVFTISTLLTFYLLFEIKPLYDLKKSKK